MTLPRVRALLVGFLTIVCAGRPAMCQQASASSAPAPRDDRATTVVSAEILDQIRNALASEHRLLVGEPPRFHVEVRAKQQTFADYVKGSDLRLTPIRMPTGHQMFSGGSGLDLGQLIERAFKRVIDAKRERDLRQIRSRIDQELRALSGVK